MKIEVKWIDGAWQSFSDFCEGHRSAGVLDIVEMVEQDFAPHMDSGLVVTWKVVNNRFVDTLQGKPVTKLSKSKLNT